MGRNAESGICLPPSLQAIADFRANLGGAPLQPGDDAYDATRVVWNGIINRRPARSPVPEKTREQLPSWSSDVFGAALASCRHMILGMQAWHALRALNDHQLRDIGLSRKQIQPALLTALAANWHLERW